jgi:HEAT repeat protein
VPGGKEAFERKVEALASLRAASSPELAIDPLRKAVKDRSNYLVSKAAALVGESRLTSLIPDLLAAFDRFMVDPAKTDPKCWAKDAIVKALKDLNHDDPAVFLRGIEHVQMEPVWGGSVDTALTLRGACALALVGCSLDRQTILTRLIDLLADEKPVRSDAIRALGQCPGPDTALLLRLKALLGDKESEVTGQCFDVLLEISPADSVPFVARFFAAENPDVRSEAASALAASREPQAIEALKRCFAGPAAAALKIAILQSLAGSRLIAGAEFLLSVVDDGSSEHAALAVQSLASGRFREEFRERIETSVRRRSIDALTTTLQKEFQKPAQGPLGSPKG